MCLRCGVANWNAEIFMRVGKLFRTCHVQLLHHHLDVFSRVHQVDFYGKLLNVCDVMEVEFNLLFWWIFIFMALAHVIARKIEENFPPPTRRTKPCNWNLFLFLSDSVINHTCFPLRCFSQAGRVPVRGHMSINIHTIITTPQHSMIPLPQCKEDKEKQRPKKSFIDIIFSPIHKFP